MVKKFLVFLVLVLALVSLVNASCVVNFGKESYVAGETITAAMSCSLNTEKNTAYNLTWTYQNGTMVERDTGTTPSVAGTLFYQTYTIPTGWPNGIFVNASLSGAGLTVTQNDSANVTSSATANSLIISNSSFGGGYLGLVSSIKATVTDENGKKISGGSCEVSALSNDETRVLLDIFTTPINGLIEVSDILPPTRFNEGEDYSYRIHCYCGSSGSSTECVDEDGNQINNSVGSAKNFFTTRTWIVVNTVTDSSLYNLKDEVFVCANVTNVNYSSRIPLHIYYQIRCSKGADSNSDTDRIIIGRNEEVSPDARGVSANTTQMQCMKFVIPEENYLMGSNSQCYASTNVWVLSNSNEEVLGYSTTSPVFNISSDELNLEADWQWVSDGRINAIVNLSEFENINGSGTGNIDIRLDFNRGFNIQNIFEIANFLSNISVQNSTSSLTHHIDYELEFLEEGYVELEIRDVDLSSGWWNISLDFYNFELRNVEALEGIENKTGTFHLDVDCPSQGLIGGNINCSITAQVEDPQLVQKEVDFTCYITDGISEFSSLNFNQMITKTPITLYREFSLPSSFVNGQSSVLQCHADYYNLGSRRDSFYDTFTAVTTITASDSGGSSSSSSNPSITGGAVAGLPDDENGTKGEGSGPFGLDDEGFKTLMKILGYIALLFVILIILGLIRRKAFEKKSHFLRFVFIALIVVGIIGVLAYVSRFLQGISFNKEFFQNSFYRGIFLTIFISLVVAFLFRVLNIRGEIKFGGGDVFSHHRRNSRLQERINREVLKKEMKHHRNYKVVKVRR